MASEVSGVSDVPAARVAGCLQGEAGHRCEDGCGHRAPPPPPAPRPPQGPWSPTSPPPASGPGLPLRSVYRPLVGIPTISVGRYFFTWDKNALIWVKNSQKRGKNGNFSQNYVKLDIFGTFLFKKGFKSKISGGSPG